MHALTLLILVHEVKQEYNPSSNSMEVIVCQRPFFNMVDCHFRQAVSPCEFTMVAVKMLLFVQQFRHLFCSEIQTTVSVDSNFCRNTYLV